MKNMTRKQDLSLSTFGASKEKTGKTTTEDVSNVISPSSVTSSVICIRVLVEGKLLLVPIPSKHDHLTINWLAEETAKRYKSLEEVEPKLRLLTADGAILLNSDPVSIVAGMGELQGQVLSWNIPSLVASYEELCCNNNISQDSSVVAILEGCPASGSADLSDTYLEPRHLMYVLKVLSFYHQLQSLNISGNNVSDSNMKELSEYVVKLGQLRSLNMSNICISSEGFATFSQIIIERNGLQRLQNLDIGYNQLGDCLKPLGNLVTHLPALTSLLMPSVDLATQSFRAHFDFTLDTLEIIDLSYNDIGTDGVIDLLGRLNPRRIQQLHLSYTGGKTIREVGLYLQTNAPPSLRVITENERNGISAQLISSERAFHRFLEKVAHRRVTNVKFKLLDVSYCPASEEDMRVFIQGLEMCPHLEKLVLESVFGFDRRHVDHLMGCKSLCALNLAGSVDVAQPLQVVEHLATLAITSSSDQRLPRKLPFDLFTSGPLRGSKAEN